MYSMLREDSIPPLVLDVNDSRDTSSTDVVSNISTVPLSDELESFYTKIVICLSRPDEVTEFAHQITERKMVEYRCILGSDHEIDAAYFLLSRAMNEDTPHRVWNDFLSVSRYTSDLREKMQG